jgi:hypothetical protein
MLFPRYSEVLVSRFTTNQLMQVIGNATVNVDYLEYSPSNNKGYFFNGQLYQNTFNLSLLVEKADSFLPLIKGKIEQTPMGCILFVSYELFSSSSFFLFFWSIIPLLLGLMFILMEDKYVHATVALLFSIANYGFGIYHFKRKVAVSSAIFRMLLNPPVED